MILLCTLLFAVFTACGLFFLIADFIKMPTLATEKALILATNTAKKDVSMDVLVGDWATKLEKFVKIQEFKRARLVCSLNAAGIPQSPEEYVASCILKGSLIGLLAVPCLFLLPVIAPFCLVIGIMTYFKEVGKADKLLEEKREKIEAQLPRFAATVAQELQHSRDILAILERFKRSANEEFAMELDILTADMRSSSYDNAISRAKTRVNSPKMAELLEGFNLILQGSDGQLYFQMLAHDYKQWELQKLKAEAMKIPPKIRKLSFSIMIALLLVYLTIIVYEIIRSMGSMF